MPSVTLNVTLPAGTTVSVEAECATTVASLKEKVASAADIAVDGFELEFEGTCMDDGSKLIKEFPFEDQSPLQAVLDQQTIARVKLEALGYMNKDFDDVREDLASERDISDAKYAEVVAAMFSAGVKCTSTSLQGVLSESSRFGLTATVELLLKNGVHVNSMICGRCPMHRAASFGHSAVVSLLLSYGADVDAVSQTGSTPLLYAAISGQEAVIPLLLSHGADPTTTDTGGSNAIWWARRRGHAGTVTLLSMQQQPKRFKAM
eukprot:TRINITY_DN5995_c0_g1_i1.p1 TRINITY_DN5995_c0_g1~~TRINITY_DN5995_c0_g1_i1.p1  ORF type:complete len:262 (+),score=53.25 TRINITY_DN5995_c0_g1_i1:234-1019(+)